MLSPYPLALSVARGFIFFSFSGATLAFFCFFFSPSAALIFYSPRHLSLQCSAGQDRRWQRKKKHTRKDGEDQPAKNGNVVFFFLSSSLLSDMGGAKVVSISEG